jgi:hypoxanthine phosphoribosyltransferase
MIKPGKISMTESTLSLLDEIEHVRASADILFTEVEVEAALDTMAQSINALLFDRMPVVLCALNGGIVTAGKLLTRLTIPVTLDSICASRYRNTTSGGRIDWRLVPTLSLAGRTVLIVDDILDEGHTLVAMRDYCLEQGAASVYTAVLADKELDNAKPIAADFVGLKVENRYLFGYGMDYKGFLRNAPGIFACCDQGI